MAADGESAGTGRRFQGEIIWSGRWLEKRERERETGGEGLRRGEEKDGATGGANAALLLHAAAVVA